MDSRHEKGLTLVEVLVGIGILAVLIFASVSLTTSALTTTRGNLDRQFATEKAISMLEELKSVAQNTTGGNIVVLDQYDDGVLTKDELTIQTGALPGDPISGNYQGPLGWLYQRRVSVIRIGGQSNAGVRLVRVAVFRNDKSGMHLLAEVSSVVRTLATILPQSQVYDVYCIAAENVPGWWVYTSSLVPFVQDAINELEDRNPGLKFRVHWITELSYGRDQEYRPFINSANPSTNDINSVYFYPGELPTANAVLNPPDLDEYYPVARFNAHMNVDGADTNGFNAASNPFPYAVADQYNHSMRYLDEMATWQARFNAGQETELTYRLLLDQMVMNPSRYTNSILINLHGELFPFPPIRNFSDPARDPEQIAAPDLRNIRVVTHPENLAYGNTNAGTDDVKLRVYSYEAPTGTAVTVNPGVMPVPITVLVKGVDLTSVGGTVKVQAIEGGPGLLMVTQSGNPSYAKVNALFGPPMGLQMYATVGTVAGAGATTDTLITLFNSPLRAPVCAAGNCNGNPNNGQGLAAGSYLYNQQYIPAPLENFASNAAFVTPFFIDLTSTINAPKNTARWVITIDSNNLNQILTTAGFPTTTALTIETRIGAPAVGPPVTGTVAGSLPLGSQLWPPAMTQQTNNFPPLTPTAGQPGAPAARNHPANLSRTYVWRGTNLWLYGDGTDANPGHLPMTERFQFLGDPRHCPYADLKRPHVTGTFKSGMGLWDNESRLGMGYNRYFDDFENAANGNQVGLWPGWTYTVGPTTYGVKNNSFSFGSVTDDGWNTGGNGQLEIDIQRAFQIVRNSLTVGRSIYTTMTGFSYYYIGIGGEIGYDSANQFPNSIPLSTKPFTGVSGTTTEQSIINNGAQAQGCGVKYVRAVGAGNNYWWSMNWLGELYPDTAYTGTYAATAANITAGTAGNLPTGTAATNYRRVLRATIAPTNVANFTLPSGTTFNGGLPGSGNEADNAVRRTNVMGSTNLFWTGTPNSTFHHIFADGTFGNLINQGVDIAAATTGYNFPLLNPVPNARPFSITNNNPGFNPESFLESEYGPMFPAKQEALFYQHSSGVPGSALESLRDPNSNKVAFIVVNGLSPAGAAGQSFIARWSFLSLIHSFFQAGLYTDATACPACPYRVRQLPRVSITYPNVTVDLNNVGSINIQWALTWKRWDNNSYTPAYAAGFTETEPVQYQVMYSDDNGTTWKWCDTSIASTPRPGMRDASALIAATSFNWNTPAATFPMGNYLIRVEAFRQNYQQHYSFHQFRAFIRR